MAQLVVFDFIFRPVCASHLMRRAVLTLQSTNIGNAKLAGLQKDLKMTNDQYNDSLTIFFISYSIFEPITNILLKRWRPSVFIPAIMLAWVGATSLLLQVRANSVIGHMYDVDGCSA
jgi:hypothetical protein